MREPSAIRVVQRWADAEPKRLVNTLELKAQIAELDKKVESLTFQKSHATTIGRRTSLLSAVNAVIRQRNELAKRYNEATGHV